MVAKASRAFIGVVPAVVLKLLDENAHAYTETEELVIDAIRRSDTSLAHADIDEIATRIANYSPEQLQGFTNNVKGIYHELKYAAAENADGDEYLAELYELTNHPGADIRLVNGSTGEITDIQLKATNAAHQIREHQDKYPNVDIQATQEVSEAISDVGSSGFSNVELTGDVTGTFEGMMKDDLYVESAVASSALLSAAINTKSLLSGQQTQSVAARKVLEDLGVAGVSAGLIELLVG
jgi:hypothetical protein